MEGKGLDPTVEALFGPNGFFPDTVMKTIFYASDKMPSQIKEILKTIIPALNDNKKKQVCQTWDLDIKCFRVISNSCKPCKSPSCTLDRGVLGTFL